MDSSSLKPFQAARKKPQNPVASHSGNPLGKPTFSTRDYSDTSSRKLNLQVFIPEELTEQILARLQDDSRNQEAVELIESITQELSSIVFNAIIDLTQMRSVDVTATLAVTGYEGGHSLSK